MEDLQLDFSGNKSFCIFCVGTVQRADCSASEEIASSKVMQILESRKVLLVESGIRNPSSSDKKFENQ